MTKIIRPKKKSRLLYRLIASYLSIALAGLILASSIGSVIYQRELRSEQESAVQSILDIAAGSLSSQLSKCDDIANEMSVRAEFMRNYFTRNYSSEKTMMQLIDSYGDYMTFPYSHFVYYRSLDAIYSGKAKYTAHIFYDYLLEENVSAEVREMLLKGQSTACTGGSYIYIRHINILHTEFDLIFIIPLDGLETYVSEITGMSDSAISFIYRGGYAYGEAGCEYFSAATDELTIGMQYAVNESIFNGPLRRYTNWIVLSLIVMMVAAYLISVYRYRPISEITKKYIDDIDESKDELENISNMIEKAVNGYSASQKELSEMSMVIDEQRQELKRRILHSIIHNGIDSERTLMSSMAGIKLSGNYFCIALMPLEQSDDTVRIEDDIYKLGSPNEVSYHTVFENSDIYVLINAVDEPMMLSAITMLTSLYDGIKDLHFSEICASQEEIAGLMESLTTKKTPVSIIRAEIDSIVDSVMAGRAKDAITGIFDLEKSISAVEDGYETIGIHSELMTEIRGIMGPEMYDKYDGRLMSALFAKNKNEYINILESLVSELCAQNAYPDGIESTDEIICYISENCGEYSMSLETIASHFDMTGRQISNVIKSKTGYSYIDYIKKVRVDKAVELLTGTDLKVTEIAESVGYTNVSYFIRLFREKTGYTPSTYRSAKRALMK